MVHLYRAESSLVTNLAVDFGLVHLPLAVLIASVIAFKDHFDFGEKDRPAKCTILLTSNRIDVLLLLAHCKGSTSLNARKNCNECY